MERTSSTEYQEGKADRAAQLARDHKHHRIAYLQKSKHGKNAAAHYDETPSKENKRAIVRVRGTWAKQMKDTSKLSRASERNANTESDEVAKFSQTKHVLCYRPMFVFGSAPPRALRRAKPLLQATVHPIKLRQVGTGALQQRFVALESGHWPRELEENVRVAASLLRRLSPMQRPGSLRALEAWFRRRGCCSVRSEMLMTPGALVVALLPLIQDLPALHRAIAPFAAVDAGVEPKDKGPPPERSLGAAARVCALLRGAMGSKLLTWTWQQCARWLCLQSFDLLVVEPSSILEDMMKRGCYHCKEDGRLIYDEISLSSIAEPCKRGSWRESDLEKVQRNAVCERTSVSLGYGFVAKETGARLKEVGLRDRKEKWRREAISVLGDDAPGISSVKAKLRRGRLVLTSAALGTDVKHSEIFAQALVTVVRQDLQTSCPKHFQIDGVVIRGTLAQLSSLEGCLGCGLGLVRNEDGEFGGSLLVHLPRDKDVETYERPLGEILSWVFGAEPHFRLPGAVTQQDISYWGDNWNLVMILQRRLGVSLDIWESADGFDLVAWLNVAEHALPVEVSMELYKGERHFQVLAGALTTLRKYCEGMLDQILGLWEELQRHKEYETVGGEEVQEMERQRFKDFNAALMSGKKVAFGGKGL